MSFIYFILIGGVAGWIAGNVMKGGGLGVVMNIILGIVGGLVGGLLFSLLGLATTGMWGSLVTSVVGAIVVLFVAGKIKK